MPWYELQVGLAPCDIDVFDQSPVWMWHEHERVPPRPVDKSADYWGIQWHHGVVEEDSDRESMGFLLHSAEDNTSIWSDHGVLDDDGQWSESEGDPYESCLGYYSSSSWREGWQPKQNPGQVLGLLWDADAGNLTVFENGQRIGFTNSKRWIGEIKGDLCWSVTVQLTRPGYGACDTATVPDANISVRATRRPVPVLTEAEAAAEQAELAQMAALKAQRTAVTDILREERDNPKAPCCRRPWAEIGDGFCQNCQTDRCQLCCYCPAGPRNQVGTLYGAQ